MKKDFRKFEFIRFLILSIGFLIDKFVFIELFNCPIYLFSGFILLSFYELYYIISKKEYYYGFDKGTPIKGVLHIFLYLLGMTYFIIKQIYKLK